MDNNCTVGKTIQYSFCDQEKQLRKEKPCGHGNITQLCVMRKYEIDNYTNDACYHRYLSLCEIPFPFWNQNRESICRLPFFPTLEVCFCENSFFKNHKIHQFYECECMPLFNYFHGASERKHPNAKNCTCECEDIYKKKCKLYDFSFNYPENRVMCQMSTQLRSLPFKINCTDHGKLIPRNQTIESCNYTKYFPPVDFRKNNKIYLNFSRSTLEKNESALEAKTETPKTQPTVTHSSTHKKSEGVIKNADPNVRNHIIPSSLTRSENYVKTNLPIVHNETLKHFNTHSAVRSYITIPFVFFIILGIIFIYSKIYKKRNNTRFSKVNQIRGAPTTEKKRSIKGALFKSNRSKNSDDFVELLESEDDF